MLRRRHDRSSCVIRVEAHAILFAVVLMNVLWFYYLIAASNSLDAAAESSSTTQQQMMRQRRAAETKNTTTLQDSVLFAFTIRDAKRLVPTDPPPGIHIYDFVDVYGPDQLRANAQLYLDGRYIEEPHCQQYNLGCYQVKLLQVFQHLVNHTQSKYYFYMESDNTLCVPLLEIQALAVRQDRYFIGTGIGASGWLMRRDFLVDFLDEYLSGRGKEKHQFVRNKETLIMPDVVASWMLMEKRAWSVSNRYLVSHTILPTQGSKALTQRVPGRSKHLPRCLEPHRGRWGPGPGDTFGWDYFDYDKCPNAEVFPCHNDDFVEAKPVIQNGTTIVVTVQSNVNQKSDVLSPQDLNGSNPVVPAEAQGVSYRNENGKLTPIQPEHVEQQQQQQEFKRPLSVAMDRNKMRQMRMDALRAEAEHRLEQQKAGITT